MTTDPVSNAKDGEMNVCCPFCGSKLVGSNGFYSCESSADVCPISCFKITAEEWKTANCWKQFNKVISLLGTERDRFGKLESEMKAELRETNANYQATIKRLCVDQQHQIDTRDETIKRLESLQVVPGVNDTIDVLQEKVKRLEAERVNEYARASRIIEWLKDENSKPAVTAFTEGPERQLAYEFEDLLAQLSNIEAEPRRAMPPLRKERVKGSRSSFGDRPAQGRAEGVDGFNYRCLWNPCWAYPKYKPDGEFRRDD